MRGTNNFLMSKHLCYYMRYIFLCLLFVLLFPLVLAHEHPEDSQELHAAEDFGPLGGGPNDLARFLPWNYFLEGDIATGIFITIFWLVTLGGVGHLLFLILGRLIKA